MKVINGNTMVDITFFKDMNFAQFITLSIGKKYLAQQLFFRTNVFMNIDTYYC